MRQTLQLFVRPLQFVRHGIVQPVRLRVQQIQVQIHQFRSRVAEHSLRRMLGLQEAIYICDNHGELLQAGDQELQGGDFAE